MSDKPQTTQTDPLPDKPYQFWLNPDGSIRVTDKMIEAGAKAAYGTIMCNEEDWPDVSGSVPAEYYRDAAKACFLAMEKVWRDQ